MEWMFGHMHIEKYQNTGQEVFHRFEGMVWKLDLSLSAAGVQTQDRWARVLQQEV
jgi:hypothetical protein